MKKINLIALSCIFAFASCGDMLDIKQHGVLNYNTYYQTDEQIISADVAMYLEVRGWEYNCMLCKNMLSDDFYAGGSMRGDNINLEALNEFTFDAEESYIQSMFTTYYTLIYKANVILGHVDPEKGAIAKQAIAEAKVLRAWAYFDLISMWGNPPLVDHELVPSEYNRPNGTAEELWGLVEKDLTEAISSGALAEKSGVNDRSTWRVTKQFAQAILGKAYLWQGKNAEAAAQFNDIVKSGKYALYTGNYGDLHLGENKYYCESMFETNRTYDSNSPYGNFSFYYLMINWRMDKINYPSDTPIMHTGWGFCTPAKDLYDEFVAAEGAEGYRLNQTMKTYEQVQSELGMTVKSAIINDGLFMWKTRVLENERGYASDYVYNADALWMRYAEVLLCGAEASLAAGDNETALDYINQIRSRAKLPALGSVTLSDIKREKRLELCGEGQRFQDLLRWGDAAAKLAGNGKEYPMIQTNGTIKYVDTGNKLYGFKSGKHDYLPYPATETRLNSAIKQNPGY